jgi:hypothetical protein
MIRVDDRGTIVLWRCPFDRNVNPRRLPQASHIRFGWSLVAVLIVSVGLAGCGRATRFSAGRGLNTYRAWWSLPPLQSTRRDPPTRSAKYPITVVGGLTF